MSKGNSASFNQFTDVGQYTKYGSWGTLQNILETSSPKYDALVNIIAAQAKAASTSGSTAVPTN